MSRRLALWMLSVTMVMMAPSVRGERVATSGQSAGAAVGPGGKFEFLPVNSCVTSRYGKRSIDGRADFHSGCDFRAKTPTPIVAVGEGKVIGIGKTDLCGNYVEVQFDSPRVVGHYCHLSSVSVMMGQKVNGGQVLGTTGKTGTRHPHLHFVLKPHPGMSGLKRPGKSFDPLQYLPPVSGC